MPENVYQQLEQSITTGGVDAALSSLADRLREEKNYFDLFSVRLMQGRHRLGLPVASSGNLDALADPLRSQMEEVYVEACRETGNLFLDEGRLSEAWMYLRYTDAKDQLAAKLETVEPDEENLDDFVQVAVHEGVAPRRGFEIVLANYGICNAITMFDGAMYERPPAVRNEVAAVLIRALHEELVGNLKAEVARQEGGEPPEGTVRELVADRDWMFEEDAYHIDTSHLHSVVRFARSVEDPEVLRLALDLTAYGRRLSEQFQFQTEEPFADVYGAHAKFFAAQLGEDVDAALEYFREKATLLDPDEHGTSPAEVYVVLLSKLGRHREALEAAGELIPPGEQTSGFAPSLLELAGAAGDYSQLMDISRRRDDVLSFAAGLVECHAARG